MTGPSSGTETYYPPPESEGGWRYLTEPEEIRAIAGMDPERLDLVRWEQEITHDMCKLGLDKSCKDIYTEYVLHT